MPAPASTSPRKQWTTALFEDKGAGLRKDVIANGPDVPTTLNNNLDVYLMVPEDGSLHSVEVSFADALAVSDTNYVTFTLLNLGQDGLGTAQMLAAVPENTTKLTGGIALVANGRRALKIATGTLLKVLAGDRLRFRFGNTGTIVNSLRGPVLLIRFNP